MNPDSSSKPRQVSFSSNKLPTFPAASVSQTAPTVRTAPIPLIEKAVRATELPISPTTTPTRSISQKDSSRLESVAFYVFLATIILAPLAFFPTAYIIVDAIKTIFIALGTLISAIMYGIIAYKEKTVTLPPRSIIWTSVLVAVSLVVSSFASVNFGKSFFGQGFELNSASFILILFLAGLVAFTVLQRRIERATVLYIGMTIPFIILAILHGLRLLIGPSFMTLGVLSSVTSTLVGTWYDLGTYAIVIVLIALPALAFLSLSRRVKITYWVLLVVALVSAFLVNSVSAWSVAAIVLLGVTIVVSSTSSKPVGGKVSSFVKRIAWIPLVLCIVAVLLSRNGAVIAGPIINKLNASYNTLTLPWQLTLDVDAGVIKDHPLLGVGPNHFSQAYITYKPIVINSTNIWSTEFNFGYSLVSTFVATQGILGIVVWGLFFIFLGILGIRSLRRLPTDPNLRFIIVSSVSVATFLWIMTVVSVPAHSILLLAFVATAIGLSAGIKSGILLPYICAPRVGSLSRTVFTVVMFILVVAGLVWGVVYIKDTTALAYFGLGVKTLNVKGDSVAADIAFSKAQSLNPSDIYLRARAEAGIAQANKLMVTVNKDTPASTSQIIATQVIDIINSSIKYAQAAIISDPSNYYNYVSEARVSELATKLRMDKAYENAVSSYTNAIKANPLNPSLYLNLAQLQASQNKLDDALKTIGVALQVKNNYLEAIFLLSQIEAAQGKLGDAIIAAQVAVQINPQNPVLLFQLGLLQYNNKDYANAAKALEAAVKTQPDYANAQYFLGLTYVRLNDLQGAISQFESLAKSNPDNQEVAFILKNLQEGKSPFADAKPPVTPTPEKRSSLPIKEKKK
jgi:tetratricopeptide (TPR) repeat protein